MLRSRDCGVASIRYGHAQMSSALPFDTMTHLIQTATAPVVLLSAVGIALSVFAARLGRVVDRARHLETQLELGTARRDEAIAELRRMDVRARLIYLSLGFGTTAGTLVCALIALSFTGALLHTDLAIPVAMLFIAAVCCIGISLLVSMREVYLAIRNIRFRYPVELR